VIIASGTGARAVFDQTTTGRPTGTEPLRAFREEKPGSVSEKRLLRGRGERGKRGPGV